MIEGERHTEQIDAANHLADMYTKLAMQQQVAKLAPEQVRLADGTWPTTECVDCGEEIPEKRLEMARIRCVVCQEILEKRKKTYAYR